MRGREAGEAGEAEAAREAGEARINLICVSDRAIQNVSPYSSLLTPLLQGFNAPSKRELLQFLNKLNIL